MTKIEYRNHLIESGIVRDVDRINKAFYKFSLKQKNYDIKDCWRDMPIDDANALYDFFSSTQEGIEMYNECQKILHANNARKNRVKNRIDLLLQKPCVFVTLTFSDKTLQSTTAETRRRYVRKFLDRYGMYVANKDFGAKNNREHYHAVVQVDKIDCDDWNFGNIDFKRVLSPNSTAIAKYISKLTNHALKATTQGNRIIYGRMP